MKSKHTGIIRDRGTFKHIDLNVYAIELSYKYLELCKKQKIPLMIDNEEYILKGIERQMTAIYKPDCGLLVELNSQK